MKNAIYNPFTLDGKTILVTGASSGIGRATAIECSKMGARVILTARNEGRLRETLSMMEENDHKIIPADLSQELDINKLVESTPRLNGVVNAAGKTCDKPIKYYSSLAVEDTFKLNAFAAIYLVRDLLKRIKILNYASLVFVSSIASNNMYQTVGNGIYSASKAAIDSFSRQCAIELSKFNIRSNTISPGFINTPMTTSYILDYSLSSSIGVDDIKQKLGKPEDVARLAVYLLSDAASFVTGSSFVIDGGLSLIK